MHTDLLDTVLVSKDTPTAAPSSQPNVADMKDTSGTPGEEAKCPVDHKTRETWLQQARAAPTATPTPTSQPTPPPQPTAQTTAPQTTSSWSSWFRLPFSSQKVDQQSQQQADPPASRPHHHQPSLDESRVVSSIPRSSEPGPSSCPSNHEQETGASASGNWIYPSEKMFFEAMKRKGFDSASAADMKTVVPIHNAVNERAWAEILRWEAAYPAPCGGPRLHSFAGLSGRMSPKARLNTLLGYTAPFDRHDWVVDRCGTQVEYVIDFYAGRNDGAGTGKLNFYLDVRPKMNSWEGIKMRALRATGLA